MTRLSGLALVVLALATGTAACVAPSAGAPAGTLSSPSPAVPASTPPDSAAVALPSLEPLSADEAWAMLIPGDPTSISYRSPAALMRDADLVVVGRLGGVRAGPDNADKYGVVAYLASVTLDVERVIRGTLVTREPGTLTLWVVIGIGDGGSDFSAQVDQFATSVPRGERAVLFLVNMAAKAGRNDFPADDPQADPYAYQILGGQGFLRDVGGRVEPPGLSADALAIMAGRWQEDLRGRPFDQVVRSLEAIAAGTP